MKNNTTQEQKSLLESLSQDDKSALKDLQFIWDKSASYEPNKAFNKDAAYKKFMADIHADAPTPSATASSSIGKILLRIAITIGTAALIFFLYTQFFSHKTIKTTDTIEFAMLEDGTEVWLNKYSELKYPKSFASDSREVSLKGEAYFDVERNEEAPFTVNLSQENVVTVLGTSFNINDRFDNKVEVSVTEGKVNLKNGRNIALSQDLAQGEKGILNASKNDIRKEEFYENITAWKENEIKFIAQPLESILDNASIFHGVQFKLDHASIDCEYTMTIDRNQNVAEFAQSISTSFPNIKITKAKENLYYVQGTCK